MSSTIHSIAEQGQVSERAQAYVALLFVCDVGSIVAGVLIGALIIR